MTRRQAQEILAAFRPGTADEADAAFNEARGLAAAEPALARWFDQHCETYLILRRKLQSVPVPQGLKERILAQQKVDRPLFQRYGAPLLAMAASIAIVAGLYSSFGPIPSLPTDYGAYRQRMTESALRSYSMDLTTKDTAQIREFLKARNAPAEFALPAGLNSAAPVGCVVSRWQGRPVSMICFKSGRPLPPGGRSDLWLFVTDRQNVPDGPPSGLPVFAQVNQASTASWSDDKQTYLLAAVADEAFLGKYLQ